MLKQTLSLDGPWTFRGLDADHAQRTQPHTPAWPDGEWLPGQVPGTVQQDLLRLGRIPDPYLDANALQLTWIEEKDWWYRHTFTCPSDFTGDRVLLKCDGLDTYASLWLNGTLIGRHANMFVPFKADVTGVLRPGRENELLILFRSIDLELRDKDVSRMWGLNGDKTTSYARKAQCSFGWDWAPRLVTFGIWRPIRLVAHRYGCFRDLAVRTYLERPDRARLELSCELEGLAPEPQPAEVTLTVLGPEGETVATSRVSTQLAKGIQTLTARLDLDRPRLWWPNGCGDQPLYRVNAQLLTSGEVLDEASTRFGVRKIELRQEPIATGRTFTFVINGQPIFCKGANWGPAEALTLRTTEGRYRALIQLARDANMNMLRVWGGGIYEDQVFYDVCDEMGILVWQDFMYACASYPDDEATLCEAEREARLVIRALRNHPCLAMWCGNNENQWIHIQRLHNGVETNPALLGQAIYDEVLPRICVELDPTRPYWPSSPWGGETPNSPREGDRHSYTVGLGIGDLGDWDLSWANAGYHRYGEDTGKFISEFGSFVAFPEPETIERFLDPPERHTDSAAWREHVPHSPTWPAHFQDIFDFQLANILGVPGEKALGMGAYQCYARLVAGEALAYGIEHYRRAKFQCSGVLFWFFASIWPAIDWACVDHYLVPKPLYYYIKRAFAPVLVSLRAEPDGGVSAWVVNDRLAPLSGTLTLSHGTFTGEVLWRDEQSVHIPANSSVCLQTLPGDRLRARDRRTAFVAASLTESDAVWRARPLFLDDLRVLLFPQATLTARLSRATDGRLTVTVHSDVFARAVRLALYGAVFQDNYSDLLPGEERQVSFDPAAATGRVLEISAVNAPQPIRLAL
jgi:beta-mannosidase